MQNVPKKIPMRQCVGCRQVKPQKELFRVVPPTEGPPYPGRGAYLCPDPACLARAKKSRALERAFSAQLPDEVWAGLEAQMKEVPQDAQ